MRTSDLPSSHEDFRCLAQLARAVRIHIVWSPSRPQCLLDAALRYNFSVYQADKPWDPAVTPHVVVPDGPGKTQAVRSLHLQATASQSPVWVVEGSGRRQLEVLHNAMTLMETRYQLIADGKAAAHDLPILTIFFDEGPVAGMPQLVR